MHQITHLRRNVCVISSFRWTDCKITSDFKDFLEAFLGRPVSHVRVPLFLYFLRAQLCKKNFLEMFSPFFRYFLCYNDLEKVANWNCSPKVRIRETTLEIQHQTFAVREERNDSKRLKNSALFILFFFLAYATRGRHFWAVLRNSIVSRKTRKNVLKGP